MDREHAAKVLGKVLRRRAVVELDELYEVLGTRSRMTVFRRLKDVGYLTSFTHAGRYYTLREVPRFGADGLWFEGEIGFSRAGTLKETLAERIPVAEAGCTHGELAGLLRVRVYNALLDLVRGERIGRTQVAGQALYVSAAPPRAAEQVARRVEWVQVVKHKPPLAANATIEVLVEALLLSRATIDPAAIVRRLAARGVEVTAGQVEEVCSRYGLRTLKKTPARASRRSRR